VDGGLVTAPRTTVLVTGVGGPAGVAVVRSLLARPDLDVVAADADRYASGLYLVPPDRRVLVPMAADPVFAEAVDAACQRFGVRVLIPTVDVELPILARSRERLAEGGVQLAAPTLTTLETCLDKLALARACAGVLPVPRTEPLGPAAVIGRQFPVIVKPRRGAGSRGIHLIERAEQLAALGSDEEQLVQDHLPGEEYSVDVLAGPDGRVIAAVPRSRLRVDSGVAIAGATFHDVELQQAAAAVARAVGLTSVANVQLRRDRAGRAALLEVNPRFPGALPLTIAAGVDMPCLVVDLVLGRAAPESLDFRELAVVRHLEDVFIAPTEFEAVALPRPAAVPA